MKIPTEVCNQLSRLKKKNNNNNTNISKYRLMCGIQNVNVHQRTLKNCFKKCTYSPDQATIFKCWLLSRGVKPGGGVSRKNLMEYGREPRRNSNQL